MNERWIQDGEVTVASRPARRYFKAVLMRDSQPDYKERNAPTDLSFAPEFSVPSVLPLFKFIFDRMPVVSISNSVT